MNFKEYSSSETIIKGNGDSTSTLYRTNEDRIHLWVYKQAISIPISKLDEVIALLQKTLESIKITSLKIQGRKF